MRRGMGASVVLAVSFELALKSLVDAQLSELVEPANPDHSNFRTLSRMGSPFSQGSSEHATDVQLAAL